MSPSKTWWRARPPALARYIAVSASRSMSSGFSYPALDSAMPTLTLVNTSCPRTSSGAASSSWIRSATPVASASQLIVVEQHRELVAAEARQRVAGAQAALEPARGADQELVAGLVSRGCR